jgi:hypothetical protein
MLVSRAPLEKLQGYKKRMGGSLDCASTVGSEFNRELGFLHTEEEPKPFLEGELPPAVEQNAEACEVDAAAYVAEGPGLEKRFQKSSRRCCASMPTARCVLPSSRSGSLDLRSCPSPVAMARPSRSALLPLPRSGRLL